MNYLPPLFSSRLSRLVRSAISRSLGSCALGATTVMAGLASQAAADTSVWLASSGDSHVYLGGTVHLLRPTDYPLPEEFEEAYENSDTLVFETDISAMNDPSVQMRLLGEVTYTDSRTLRSVLSDDAYSALSNYLETVGLPMMMLEKMKPGMVVSTLQVLEFQKLGFTPQGVDMHFNTRAVGEDKAIQGLESLDQQISFLAGMGEGNESEFVLMSLEEMEQLETGIEDMISAWREGDNDRLAELFINDMRAETPELYQSLLVERNNNWMPAIEQMFSEEGTEFVLVGAAHLVGEHGLISLLEANGYQVRQL
ncbi:MAG: TraB/GumN family protein [Pseudohongiellaceae bacterium]